MTSTILAAVIAGNQAEAIYEQQFINAVAAAGTIKQHEAKRRLKTKFRTDFSVKEWEARIHAAEGEISRNLIAIGFPCASSAPLN